MKFSFLLILICLIALQASAQLTNKRPKIVGQDALSTIEDQSITILMTNLEVEDSDDWFYPWGFTMQIYDGDNYTYQGHVVTPARDFSGKLSVKVTVHDGQDESNQYDLEITVHAVNDKPVITGHETLSTNESQALTILLQHLTVHDPDNNYPGDFSLRVHSGNNYVVSGNQITPVDGFTGTLSVNVTVNDGAVDSDIYALPVNVKAVDRVPQITGQATLQVNEDQPLTLLFSHLTVVDNDNNYPEGFTLGIAAGDHYTVSNATITPQPDFFGRLTVPVTVSDGKNTSKPFNVSITVTPVNDVPVISNVETDPLFYGSTDVAVAISKTLTVQEADEDSIMFAEVRFAAGMYQIDVDKLLYTQLPNSKIRGVFDPASGVLTLLGQASPAAYSTALRSVQYQSLLPTSGVTKKLTIMVNDGKANSQSIGRDVVFGHAVVSLDIPTGFTPNGDQANDTWKIVPLKTEEAYLQARIRVYNKTGALVYESVGFKNEWDGRFNGELLPADTYFYTIDLNIEAPEGYVKGLVTILR